MLCHALLYDIHSMSTNDELLLNTLLLMYKKSCKELTRAGSNSESTVESTIFLNISLLEKNLNFMIFLLLSIFVNFSLNKVEKYHCLIMNAIICRDLF